jgi:outer membrane protein TolC
MAAELARDRYGVGAATQLDVIRAQEDAFRAEVTRIQADTDLAYARAALRASAGQLHEGNSP